LNSALPATLLLAVPQYYHKMAAKESVFQ
jgi:hypothetical protein